MPEETIEAASKAPDSATLLSSSSNLCFVLMPFGEPFDAVYKQLIQPVITASGLESMRADEMYYPGTIMEQIRAAIQQSRLCVVDVTGKNSNVMYELGMAQTLGKPTILLSQDYEDIPFDLRHYRIISYGKDLSTFHKAELALAKAIQALLGLDRLDEARQLIKNGMVRAGVALLGILLEHGLRLLVSRHDTVCAGRRGIGRPVTLGQMVELLSQGEVVSRDEIPALRQAISIRNRAVHDLAEPEPKDAEAILQTVESFVRRHIGDSE